MTTDEVKAQCSMRSIVERYGYQPNRAGFITCPFHTGDRTPSLKVYERDFHCHACGAHGDIFTFVQQMDHITFREAFYSLGGKYDKPSFSSNLSIYKAQKVREMRQKEQERLTEQKRLNNVLISIYRTYMERSEPLSVVWCDCHNALQYQLYIHEKLNGLEAG